MMPEDFLKHAAECRYMAKFSRDNENKLTWLRMADRWIQCAELAKHRNPSSPRKAYVNVGRARFIATLRPVGVAG
jgi:hypothetical protein